MTTKLYLEVKADSNDADYVTSRNEISKEDVELLKPLFKAIKKQRKTGHNWCTSYYANDPSPEEMYPEFSVPYEELDNKVKDDYKRDLVGWFNESFVPTIEGGIHTIVEIKLIEVVKETSLI